MDKEFRNVKVKKGTFYTTSKEPKQGFKEIEYPDRNSKDGGMKITYHKEFNDLTGTINKIDIHDGLFGKTLRIFVEDGDFLNVLELPLKTQYKSVTEYVRSVVQVLGNIVPKDKYTIFVNKTHKNNKGIPFKNLVFLKEDDEGNKKLVRWDIKPEEFPAINVIEDIAGDKEYDRKDRDNFTLERLVSGIEKFDSLKDTSYNNENEAVVAKADDFELGDELPF